MADRALDGLLGGDVEAGRHVVAVRALVATQTREHEAQVVQQLGGGAEGGMHARYGWALAQRDGSRHVQHLVNLGACRLADAAACVGGERFQVAAASLRI